MVKSGASQDRKRVGAEAGSRAKSVDFDCDKVARRQNNVFNRKFALV